MTVILALGMIQIPLDIREHQLSRPASLGALTLILATITTEAIWFSTLETFVRAALVALAVTSGHFLARVAFPTSVGLGDVYLVAPLSLALGYFSGSHVIVWQLISAVTGALHAILARWLLNESRIPYGPHLLISGLLILIADQVHAL